MKRKLLITFKQENPNYDKDYAKKYYEGKESPGNFKDNWSRGLNPIFVENLFLKKNTEYNFTGIYNNKIEFNHTLKNMVVLKCQIENDKSIEIVISKNLIKGIRKFENDKYNLTKFYFYFKPRNDFRQIDETMYLLNDDIPVELINNLE